MTKQVQTVSAETSRRDFLKSSAATVVGATLAVAPNVHAAGSDVIRVGLIGCGGRGTGAAKQACGTSDDVRLVAMGDMFPDRLEESKKNLQEILGSKLAVKEDHCFTGFEAYKGVIASGVDVVLLATPPHFRPLHLKAAVEAGKHVFAEKPVAVDAPGVRSVLETCEKAKGKRLSVVSGFCWRYHAGMRDTFKRVHDGAIGDITVLQCTYNTGSLWHKSLKEKQEKGWSDMEWQLRNWLYFTWLSGDHIVEQHVHSIDKMAWAMRNEYPVRAVGVGGRQVRTEPDFGHIFDHHAVVFEYGNGVKCFSSCRQQAGCAGDVSDHLFGTKGICDIWASRSLGVIKSGQETWQSPTKGIKDMYQSEHDELFASLRAGKPMNDGDWMAKSSLMAIMGRMATYTGQAITWEQALNSKEDLMPASYAFGPMSVPPVAMPGQTKFV